MQQTNTILSTFTQRPAINQFAYQTRHSCDTLWRSHGPMGNWNRAGYYAEVTNMKGFDIVIVIQGAHLLLASTLLCPSYVDRNVHKYTETW